MRPSARKRATRDHVTVDHDGGLTDVERTERPQHVTPPGDIGSRALVRRHLRDASFGHQQIRRDVPDSHHAEAILFENPADPGQQMIVAAPEGRPHPAEDAKRAPIQPDLG
jgi:hypothetical protein